MPFSFRVGQGYDVHRLTEGRPLILGGVMVPFEYGLLGHSDADVLLHAIIDALLGAAGLGDVGICFPDTDERYKGISLQPLEIVEARDGVFYEWLKRKGKLGGQHKIPRLSNDREMIEALIAINRE